MLLEAGYQLQHQTCKHRMRDSIILKLKLLGWSQQEIAGLMELEQPRIAQIINNFNIKEIYNF